MRVVSDEYYQFECIGSKCKRNCCQGWIVSLDPDTTKYYLSLNDDLGNKIKSVMKIDQSGNGSFEIKFGEKCVAQSPEGLCEIYQRYGEDRMSLTCKRFPRIGTLIDNSDQNAYCVLSNECEEVLRLLWERNDNLGFNIEYGKNREKDIANNRLLYLVVKYASWMVNTIQNCEISLGESLSAVLHVGLDIGKHVTSKDEIAIERDIDQADNVVKEYSDAFQDIGYDEIMCSSWSMISLIVVAFFDILKDSKYPVGDAFMPDPQKYGINDPQRGEMIYGAYKEFLEVRGNKWKEFMRRYYANYFSEFVFFPVREGFRNKFLTEVAPRLIILTVVPALWEDVPDKEYLSRLSVLQRIIKGKEWEEQLWNPIMEQMNPDTISYALMFAGLWRGI